jgi:Winged helix DNA-binding domain
MTTAELLGMRLANQHLAHPRLDDPTQLVAHLGAVQAQDYRAAKWALGLRLCDATDAQLDRAFDAGKFLRTHVLRPTWHFVAPADIRWMLALTGPRVKGAMASYTRSIGLDADLVKTAIDVIVRALEGGRSSTRAELRNALLHAGVTIPDPGMLGHIMWQAEVEGVVTSGPLRGKQHTHALLEERVPPAPTLSREEAVGELVWRYFNSHGPALVVDCSWWSGLTVSDVKRGLEMNHARLQRETIGEREYWFAARDPEPSDAAVHLLPNYDEFTVAYRQRNLFFDAARHPTGDSREDVPFADVVLVCGRVLGRWQRRTGEVRWWVEPSSAILRELAWAADRYQGFLEV